MFKKSNNPQSVLDPKILEKTLEKMDEDIAARFVISALSLDKNKMVDAFTSACREMEIRREKREKEAVKHMQKAVDEIKFPEVEKPKVTQQQRQQQHKKKNLTENLKDNFEKLLKDIKKEKK